MNHSKQYTALHPSNAEAVQVFSAQHFQHCDYGMLIAQAMGPHQMAMSTRALQLSPWQMVGRESVLSTLRDQLLKVVQHNTSSLLIITGDAGYGKTRFIQHLSKNEEFGGYRSKVHIFSGPGMRESSMIPLAPWRIMLEVRIHSLLNLCTCTAPELFYFGSASAMLVWSTPHICHSALSCRFRA